MVGRRTFAIKFFQICYTLEFFRNAVSAEGSEAEGEAPVLRSLSRELGMQPGCEGGEHGGRRELERPGRGCGRAARPDSDHLLRPAVRGTAAFTRFAPICVTTPYGK